MMEIPDGYHLCKSKDATMTLCEHVNGQLMGCLSLCENISRVGLAYFWLTLLVVILAMLAWANWKDWLINKKQR